MSSDTAHKIADIMGIAAMQAADAFGVELVDLVIAVHIKGQPDDETDSGVAAMMKSEPEEIAGNMLPHIQRAIFQNDN